MINNNWVFGNNCGLDFSTTPPTPTSGNAIRTREGCASISDSNGDLLFYTDGIKVWDGNHILRIPNNTATPPIPILLGDFSSTQSSIIVPDPSNSDQYYILTMDGSSNPAPPYNHFNGGILNVSNWSFQPLSTLMTFPDTKKFSPAERITAVQHENCKDYWVVTVLQKKADTASQDHTDKGPGMFRIYEINSSGIKHHIDIDMEIEIGEGGYLKSSTDRKYLGIANFSFKNVLVYPFDSSTGLVDISKLKLIKSKREVYGVEFSPNSNILYYSTLGNTKQSYVYQVDYLNNLNSTIVGTFKREKGFYAIGALQLGIDDKIYIAKDTSDSLGAILNPNVLGIGVTGCNIDNNYIQLPKGAICQIGLPNLLPNACKDCDCDCGCDGCNEDAAAQDVELIDRAKEKFNVVKASKNCPDPFTATCEATVVEKGKDLSPCFSFHWGDSKNDQIEEHDTEVFYLTVCNNYKDISYTGLRITKVMLTPNIHSLEKIQIVPDRFVNLDCLEACTCKTREFAIINRANDIAGNYSLEVEYCYEEIVIASTNKSGTAKFPLTITKD